MLTTDQKGAIAESAIALAAIRLGLEVYRPVVEGGRYDLILAVGPTKLLRVQCKWATLAHGAVVVRCYSARRGRDGMIVRTYSEAEADALAAYCQETDDTYLLWPAEFASRRVVYLRVSPSRNNQRSRINWAEAYTLGARLGPLLGP